MMTSMQIQNLTAEQVYTALGSDPGGLTSAEAGDRLREIGPNSVEMQDPWRIMRSLMRQFTNFFTILLVVSAVICFVAESVQPGQNMALLGWALAGVALLNALFSFIQEYRAERAMQALRKFLPPTVEVVRGGQTQTLLAEELVPGDLLLLSEGMRIPADTRMVDAKRPDDQQRAFDRRVQAGHPDGRADRQPAGREHQRRFRRMPGDARQRPGHRLRHGAAD